MGAGRGARVPQTAAQPHCGGMKTFLPLFLGLALWFGLAVMVGVTFQQAPAPVAKRLAPPLPVPSRAPVVAEL